MPTRPIQQLSPALVNRIAAGEVIERPASVVKELVENSLDAGATRIIVEIEDGGRELIRIIDDGSGIPPEQLPLAFASHATSKLTCDDDLFRIASMGFRGEALASIGSVSQARIISRVSDGNSDAYEIQNNGGAISDPQAAAGNPGTTIEVRNLFFNVPARRKFLKGSSTEMGHISEMILRLALPHPQVSFKLSHNGRSSLDLPATNPEGRLLAAWPDGFQEQRLPLEERDAELRLSGLIGLPALAHPTAKYQFFYLNRRPIRDKFIQHALREAYRGLTEPGRHPAGILLLEIPPGDVDVNVHPTKAEVRFRDSGRIHGLVMASVRERLTGNDLSPLAVPVARTMDDSQREDLRSKLAEFFKVAPTQGSFPTPTPVQPREPFFFPPLPAGEGRGEGAHGDERLSTSMPPHPSPLPQGEGIREESSSEPRVTFTSPAIQLHNSYLVAQSDDGMIIIDQHALHERIMYEDLLARMNRGPLESQRLLIPQTFRASSRQIAMLEQIQPLLAKLGIEASAFGPDSVAVQAFPSFLEKLEPANFVNELLEKGEQELLDLHEEELLHEILDMMACKAAVKAGDPLTAGEIEALLAHRDLVDRSSNCPHGRPTTLKLSLRDLEKQFKRTGF